LAGSRASRLLRYVQFPTFLRDWKRLRLSDEALRALERELIDSPEKGPVIEQTGGLRKLRFTPPNSAKGKSGAYRVCYAYFPAYGTVALFVAFGKNERSDLSSAEARATANALRTFEAELRRQFEHRNERLRTKR
jgi:mRNA-degrading endonuclease RelE of RelBE toxin-antitoxin system